MYYHIFNIILCITLANFPLHLFLIYDSKKVCLNVLELMQSFMSQNEFKPNNFLISTLLIFTNYLKFHSMNL